MRGTAVRGAGIRGSRRQALGEPPARRCGRTAIAVLQIPPAKDARKGPCWPRSGAGTHFPPSGLSCEAAKAVYSAVTVVGPARSASGTPAAPKRATRFAPFAATASACRRRSGSACSGRAPCCGGAESRALAALALRTKPSANAVVKGIPRPWFAWYPQCQGLRWGGPLLFVAASRVGQRASVRSGVLMRVEKG